jgi:TPR repeat protein
MDNTSGSITVEEITDAQARFLLNKDQKAFDFIKTAAENGNHEAQQRMFCILARGSEKDEAEGVTWLLKAAEQGYASSQNILGGCYLNGEHVNQNNTEAMKWFRKAAEQGDGFGQYNFGMCFLSGCGVERDTAEAIRWFRKAAEQEVGLAQFELAKCYLFGHGAKENKAEATKWLYKAADNGIDAAKATLFSYFGIEV